jgi:hypothetical protein
MAGSNHLITGITMSLLAYCLLVAIPVSADQITLADFSGSESVETFSNAIAGDEAGFFVFGNITIENIGDLECCPAPAGPSVVISGSVTAHLFGHVDSTASSYGNSIRDGQGQAHFFVDFAEPMLRAGLFLSHSSSPAASWNVTAHYADGYSEQVFVTQQNPAQDEFIGFEDPAGIERIEIQKVDGRFAYYSFIDDVRSEIPVPEPDQMPLLIAGIGLLARLGRRRPGPQSLAASHAA